jgi:hypothetical protein
MSITEWRVATLGDEYSERWSHSCWTIPENVPKNRVYSPRLRIKPIYIFGGSTRFTRYDDIVKLTCSSTGQWSSETISKKEKKKKEGLFSGKFKKSSAIENILVAYPCGRDGHTTTHYIQTWNVEGVQAKIDKDDDEEKQPQPKNPSRIVLFGGTDGKKFLNDVWIYDPVAQTWTEIEFGNDKAKPEGRTDHSAAIKDQRLFIYGGRTDKKTFSDIWVLDLETMVRFIMLYTK